MNKDNTIPSSLKEKIQKAAREHFPIDFEKLPTHSEESDFIQEQQMKSNDAIFNKQQGFIKGAEWYAQQLQSPGTSDAQLSEDESYRLWQTLIPPPSDPHYSKGIFKWHYRCGRLRYPKDFHWIRKAFYEPQVQLQSPGTSDAVEFGKWLLKMKDYNNLVDIRGFPVTAVEDYYEIFQKGKQSDKK